MKGVHAAMQTHLVEQLFRAAGFRCKDVHVHERQVENRAKALTMERRWIQAVFTYLGTGEQVSPGWCGHCC